MEMISGLMHPQIPALLLRHDVPEYSDPFPAVWCKQIAPIDGHDGTIVPLSMGLSMVMGQLVR